MVILVRRVAEGAEQRRDLRTARDAQRSSNGAHRKFTRTRHAARYLRSARWWARAPSAEPARLRSPSPSTSK